MSAFSGRIRQSVLDLLWSLWAELGISGWTRRHSDWCIDPEPLIVFTASLGDLDPRLRDESIDWCIRYERFISSVRMKAVLKERHGRALTEYGEYAATVGAHSGAHWPLAGKARVFHPSGKSGVEVFLTPAQLVLRLRALFGVGARAELVRLLLQNSSSRDVGATAASLSRGALYGKRNVLLELESLTLAGVVRRTSEGNRLMFALKKERELAAVVGPLPSVYVDWLAIFQVLGDLLDLTEQVSHTELVVAAAEMSALLRRHMTDIRQMESVTGVSDHPIPTAGGEDGPKLWLDAFQTWVIDVTETLARGSTAPQ